MILVKYTDYNEQSLLVPTQTRRSPEGHDDSASIQAILVGSNSKRKKVKPETKPKHFAEAQEWSLDTAQAKLLPKQAYFREIFLIQQADSFSNHSKSNFLL